MSIFTLLYTIFIGPLQLMFEIIFAIANRFIGHPGLAIIVLSLLMNFLVLPLYRRADAMQEEARDIDKKLKDGVAHIKKTFSGDERMMIMQAYYRQNNYKPTDALKGSVSLLLEIPFFMAAYQFLSHLEILEGVSLGPIEDLSMQDGLITVGGNAINLLPILMTLINVISSAIYLKDFPLKTKIQLYAMSMFFLVFLYKSPSGLVFYWTLNNIFSLVKTIFYKLKNPRKVLSILFSLVGLIILSYGIFVYENISVRREMFVVCLGIALQLPIIMYGFKDKINLKQKKEVKKNDKKAFLAGVLFLTVLIGALIPSALIAASPQEFVDITYYYNPLWYVVNSLCLAIGTFLVWFRVFYWLANIEGKAFFDKLIWVLAGVMIVNYLFFGTDLGIISSALQYENGMSHSVKKIIINALVLVFVVLIIYVLLVKIEKVVKGIMPVLVIAIFGMAIINIVKINNSVRDLEAKAKAISAEKPHFTLSTEGQNVIVLMLDRGMGEYIPYLFNEKPELKEQFDGFTYYSNALSYGACTNYAAPALFGGYEYTPIELNKRDSELLVDKHNESLKVMPAIFYENGYDVTVCDAPYANYEWIPDMSIYDDYPEMNTYITEGVFEDTSSKQYKRESVQRNMFCFSLMKTLPLGLQDIVYNYGNYNQLKTPKEEVVYSNQIRQGITIADGMSSAFMNPYNVLKNMPNMTNISNDSKNTFLMLTNNATHEPMMLQEPEYAPAQHVDNTLYYTNNMDRFTVDGVTINMESEAQVIHYQSNMATMIQLGKWFDYMRENDVYDNTKIIIVADHGRGIYHMDDMILVPDGGALHNIEVYYPLFMVKDFDSEGFTICEDFVTNADVPTMTFDGVVDNPVNPFTGKAITSEAKYNGEQWVIAANEWDVSVNNGYTFTPSSWYKVNNNIWDKEDWVYYEEKVIIPEAYQE